MKKRIALLLSILLTLSLTALAGCASKQDGGSDSSSGKVYYLQFKPEQDQQWQDLAKAYTKETGVPVTVVTAAEGTYESTLKNEITKSNAPTLFQVNGPVGLANWKPYCYNLKSTALYEQLTSPEFALKDGDTVYGIAYVIETYGIIYNKTLLQKYFDASWSSIKALNGIKDYNTFATVVREIQQHKKDLGIAGAFTSSGMDSSSDWRFKTHLANLPLYYEYLKDGITSTAAVKGTYLDNYRTVWDLYLDNATVPRTQIASKTGTDAETEFATGKAVFYQNGTWAVNAVTGDGKLSADELGILPIYIGVDGEEKQGLCTGSENYWCVNSKASKADIQATLDFLEWVVTSDTGTTALAEEMEFTVPFKKAKESVNPLVKIADQMIKDGKTPVKWVFSTMPSEAWKNGVGAALTAYAQGTGQWKDLETAFINGWKTEYQKVHG